MSDLSIGLEALERSRTQLPVSSYFDEALFAAEQRLIFQPMARYVGHELAVPEVGDYQALQQEADARALVRTPQGVELIGNVCRHRQAVMLRGRGNTKAHVVCPLHRWTYDLHGRLVGAPHFPEDPCLNLRNTKLQRWNGLHFEAQSRSGLDVAAELSKMACAPALDFSGYVFDRAFAHDCAYNWKSFVEVYLEDYHVGPFHPGLGQFVTCEDLRWEFGAQHSVQTVGVNSQLARPGSPVYQRWHDAVLAFRGGLPPPHGAIWLTLYPTVMVEWYPHVLVVSTLHPTGPQRTLNLVEFFYPEEIHAFERDFVEAHQAAYLETCEEDDEIALRMDAGRRALMLAGDDDAGPYQSPMEDGMQHFHEWYRRVMGSRSAGSGGVPLSADPRAPDGGDTAAGRHPHFTAALLMTGAGLVFAAMGACVKLAAVQHSPGEVAFWRGLVGMAMIAGWVRWRGGTLKTPVPGMHLWRSVVGVVSLVLWFYAIGGLPLATAMTLNFMSSVWMALFLIGGAVLLGAARVDARLVAAVLAGFVGVAMVLRPSVEPHQLWPALAGLLSGVLAAVAYLQVTALGRAGEPEVRVVFYFSAGGVVLGGVLLAAGGAGPMTPRGLALLLAVGVLATVGQVMMTRAYAIGHTLANAALQYLAIVWGFVFGVLLFAEPVTLWAIAGVALIVGAGMVATLLRREAGPANERAAAPNSEL